MLFSKKLIYFLKREICTSFIIITFSTAALLRLAGKWSFTVTEFVDDARTQD